jgi:hypothetical protein
VFIVVATGHQTLPLHLERGRDQQDHGGVGSPVHHLAGADHVDLEQDVAAGWRIREWRAVQVPQKLGPLEEAATTDVLLEGVAGHEDVGILGLGRALGAGRPRPTQPEAWRLRGQPFGDGALASPARTYQDEEQGLPGWRFSEQSL